MRIRTSYYKVRVLKTETVDVSIYSTMGLGRRRQLGDGPDGVNQGNSGGASRNRSSLRSG
jgi:hypothetical protein